jgi:hypothetical protein
MRNRISILESALNDEKRKSDAVLSSRKDSTISKIRKALESDDNSGTKVQVSVQDNITRSYNNADSYETDPDYDVMSQVVIKSLNTK